VHDEAPVGHLVQVVASVNLTYPVPHVVTPVEVQADAPSVQAVH